jgi:transcriptional regulator with XRE-family HTH domain
MTLTEFMKLEGLSDVELAARVNRDRTNVLRWRNGVTKPDFDALVAIEKISKGKVTARDFERAAT